MFATSLQPFVPTGQKHSSPALPKHGLGVGGERGVDQVGHSDGLFLYWLNLPLRRVLAS